MCVCVIHDSFLLVDSGIEKDFGCEIPFRARFEKMMSETIAYRQKIPIVWSVAVCLYACMRV